MDFKDRRVLVTGASRGLGAGLVRAFAARGARVLGVARGAEALEHTVAAVRAAGGDAHTFAADVGDKEAVHRIAGAANALLGGVDVLVHDASTLGPVPLRPLLDTECEDLEAVLQVNLVGPFRLTRALAGAMALRGDGLVVHVSSDAAVNGYPTWGAYGVSKAAFDHLARVWGAELEAFGVRFVAIDPGEMDTRMHADALPDADPATLADPDEVARRIVARLARPFPTGARLEIAAEAA